MSQRGFKNCTNESARLARIMHSCILIIQSGVLEKQKFVHAHLSLASFR